MCGEFNGVMIKKRDVVAELLLLLPFAEKRRLSLWANYPSTKAYKKNDYLPSFCSFCLRKGGKNQNSFISECDDVAVQDLDIDVVEEET